MYFLRLFVDFPSLFLFLIKLLWFFLVFSLISMGKYKIDAPVKCHMFLTQKFECAIDRGNIATFMVIHRELEYGDIINS